MREPAQRVPAAPRRTQTPPRPAQPHNHPPGSPTAWHACVPGATPNQQRGHRPVPFATGAVPPAGSGPAAPFPLPLERHQAPGAHGWGRAGHRDSAPISRGGDLGPLWGIWAPHPTPHNTHPAQGPATSSAGCPVGCGEQGLRVGSPRPHNCPGLWKGSAFPVEPGNWYQFVTARRGTAGVTVPHTPRLAAPTQLTPHTSVGSQHRGCPSLPPHSPVPGVPGAWDTCHLLSPCRGDPCAPALPGTPQCPASPHKATS